MKLKTLAAAKAAGILWAIAVLLMILLDRYTGYGGRFVDVISSVYLGINLTSNAIVAALIGTVWAFADAFIGTSILVSLYNFFVDCSCTCEKKGE